MLVMDGKQTIKALFSHLAVFACFDMSRCFEGFYHFFKTVILAKWRSRKGLNCRNGSQGWETA
jgi:hypothetical protein